MLAKGRRLGRIVRQGIQCIEVFYAPTLSVALSTNRTLPGVCRDLDGLLAVRVRRSEPLL
jgi:hypothetical protein